MIFFVIYKILYIILYIYLNQILNRMSTEFETQYSGFLINPALALIDPYSRVSTVIHYGVLENLNNFQLLINFTAMFWSNQLHQTVVECTAHLKNSFHCRYCFLQFLSCAFGHLIFNFF